MQYTGTVTQDPCADETAVQDAVRRQIEDPEDHDVSLIEECLSLTPDERLQRLTSWVAFVASARPIEGAAFPAWHRGQCIRGPGAPRLRVTSCRPWTASGQLLRFLRAALRPAGRAWRFRIADPVDLAFASSRPRM